MSDFILKEKNGPIPVLIIDTINFCNYSCIMCPQGNMREKNHGIMDFELFKKIIDELTTPPQKARVIIPFWNGEPSLYPNFAESLEYASLKKKEFPDAWEVWSLHTNFSLINEEVSQKIIKSGLFGPITVSLDAVKENTYAKIRRGGNLSNVLGNIKDYLRIRHEFNKEFPSLTIQIIVMEENFDEVIDFIDYWKEEFQKYSIIPNIIYDECHGMEKDCIFIRRCMADKPEKQSFLDEIHKKAIIKAGLIEEDFNEKIVQTDEFIKTSDIEEEKQHKDIKKRRIPCVGLWQHFGIRYDGETSACCRDFNCEMNLGNIKDSSLWQIWNSEKLHDFRKYHIAGLFENIKICHYCTGQPFGVLEKNFLESYLKSTGDYEKFKKDIEIIWS
ncbi:MAG: SPASM domain-containing protein [Candidatus Muirbacterium halophilum]|nr:SPASM domain-containing protein [Candidatus Muirbacterium halophilum]MCK9475114.1 SPASM domain-containing protein [Candidatus Muirbacterium halophilum]